MSKEEVHSTLSPPQELRASDSLPLLAFEMEKAKKKKKKGKKGENKKERKKRKKEKEAEEEEGEIHCSVCELESAFEKESL